MAEDYIVFCEKLWRGWLDDQLTLSDFVRKRFDLDAAPEPYIYFGLGARRLVGLTTNPGATMCHQCRATVREGKGPLHENDKYAKAAANLGPFYEKSLTGRARHRIRKLCKLSSLLDYKGVLEVEACPFHSPNLPKKEAFSKKIRQDVLLGQYAEHLQAFLHERPVVSLQAVSPRGSLRPETSKSPWLSFIAEIMGLDLKYAEFFSLVEKGSKTTGAAWVSKKPVRK